MPMTLDHRRGADSTEASPSEGLEAWRDALTARQHPGVWEFARLGRTSPRRTAPVSSEVGTGGRAATTETSDLDQTAAKIARAVRAIEAAQQAHVRRPAGQRRRGVHFVTQRPPMPMREPLPEVEAIHEFLENPGDRCTVEDQEAVEALMLEMPGALGWLKEGIPELLEIFGAQATIVIEPHDDEGVTELAVRVKHDLTGETVRRAWRAAHKAWVLDAIHATGGRLMVYML